MFITNNLSTFWSNVEIKGFFDCWMWLGGTDKDGYGKFKLDGKHRRAHRIAFEAQYGPIPSGLCVLHSCDIPGCCNPWHLSAGTVAQNNADRDSKGRGVYSYGEKHGISKLTDEQVYAIRADFRNINVVAAEYGVSKGTISVIRNFKRWRHLPWLSPTEDPSNSRREL